MGLVLPTVEELEVQVSRRLREVQLVCELGVSVDDELFVMCHSALNTYLSKHHVGNLAKDCPAVFVLVLTAIGATLGTGGQLWEPILEEPLDGLRLAGLEHANTGKFGEQFRKSLQSLGLPDFSYVEGRTNLTPILMHGGIPLHSSEVVWQKVQEFVRSGTTTGREIVQELRSDRTQMRYFNQPAQRFIREAGSFAVDMIERMANVVLSLSDDPESSSEVLGSRHGLPESFVEVLQRSEIIGSSVGFVVPPVHIYLDLHSGRGPYCFLPRIRERSDELLWTVCGRNHRASRFDERPVALAPTSSWRVEALVNGRRLRTRVFPSLADGGAWLFAETRSGVRVVEPSHAIEEGRYFLLAPKGVRAHIRRETDVVSAPVADVGGLGDVWSQHHVLRMDLVGANSFELIRDGDGSQGRRVVKVVPAPLRPTLEGEECSGIQELDGLRVFSGPPRIEFFGLGSIIDGFTLAIRDPKGTWVKRPLSSREMTEGRIDLASVLEWVTGQYRIEVVGAMGTGGMSETFIVLLDGRLEMEDRLFLPSEVVNVSLVYRNSPDGNLSRISTDFGAFEYRKYVRSTDRSIFLALAIPRISFDIGAVDMPPDFSSPRHRILALEDLEKPKGKRLFIRTGQPSELRVVARDSKYSDVHVEILQTSGTNASGAIELDRIVDSIRMVGADKTVIEIQLSGHKQIPMLTIQQVLEFRISNCLFQISNDGVSGHAEVEVSTETDSTNVCVHVRSLERVWEEPVVGILSESDAESGKRTTLCGPIPPGRYSIELSVGKNSRPIPSASRVKNLGSEEERQRYLSSIAGDTSRLAERIVVGEDISRMEMSKCSHDDFLRVVQFFVLRHRDFSTNSPEFISAIRCIAAEGNSRKIGEWMTQVGAEVASTRDLEIFVVRLFSIFLDDPLIAPDCSPADGEQDTDSLIAPLWAISPLIGLTFTHRMSSEDVVHYLDGLGSPGLEPNYEHLAEMSWPKLNEQIASADNTGSIFSRGYAMVHFKRLWKSCWSGRGPDQNVLDQLAAWVVRGKELMEEAFAGRPVEFPHPIASTVPSRFRTGRNTENLTIAKFVHNLFRLAWLATRVETPQETALRACEVLGESYGLSKELSDRALILAIVTERMGKVANV